MKRVQPNRCRGQDHPRADLSDREIDLIRYLHETMGWAYGQLARKFNKPKGTIAKICTYQRR